MSDNSYRDEYERSRPRSVTALIRVAQADNSPHWFAKVFALMLLMLCVLLGMMGLILPIVPGLLFLALACMMANNTFPGFARFVQRTPWLSKVLGSYLDSAKGFGALSWRGKLRFGVWVTCKVLVDSLVLLWQMLARLIAFLGKDKPRFD